MASGGGLRFVSIPREDLGLRLGDRQAPVEQQRPRSGECKRLVVRIEAWQTIASKSCLVAGEQVLPALARGKTREPVTCEVSSLSPGEIEDQ